MSLFLRVNFDNFQLQYFFYELFLPLFLSVCLSVSVSLCVSLSVCLSLSLLSLSRVHVDATLSNILQRKQIRKGGNNLLGSLQRGQNSIWALTQELQINQRTLSPSDYLEIVRNGSSKESKKKRIHMQGY